MKGRVFGGDSGSFSERSFCFRVISWLQSYGKMSDIGDWFKSIPFITRTWFAASIAVPFIGKLGLINFRHLMLVPELVFNRFHVSFSRFCSPVCAGAADKLRRFLGCGRLVSRWLALLTEQA